MFEIGEHPAKLQAKWLRFVLLCQLATADVRATNGAPVQVRSEPATTRHSSSTVVSTSAVAETTTLVTGAFGRNTTSNDTSADSADDTVRSHDRCVTHVASPYSITERRVPELIPVLGSQPAGGVSHKPGVRLPLLSARPAVISATLKRAATNFAALSL